MCDEIPEANDYNVQNASAEEGDKSDSDDGIATCDKCGDVYDINGITHFDGMILCEECVDSHTFVCDFCRETCWTDSGYQSGDVNSCEDCLDDETFACPHCNDRFPNGSNAGDDNTPLCNRCYENYNYTSCERCGCTLCTDDAYYAEDDDEYRESPYCYSCYDSYEKTAYLRSYSYKPMPVFYGNGKRYLGVELEIDGGGKDEENAKTLCNLANRHNDHIYVKADGSMRNKIMADYRSMYTKLFNAVTDAIDILQKAQLESEEQFTSSDEPNIKLLKKPDDAD